MKEYNFKEYVKRKMENISDFLNIMKKSVNEIKENVNHLPKAEETKLTVSKKITHFYGEAEEIPLFDCYQDNSIWDEVNNNWVTSDSEIHHAYWNVEGIERVSYETLYHLYSDEYVTIVYLDEDDNVLGSETYWGDNIAPLNLILELPKGTIEFHTYSNYPEVIENYLKNISKTEKPNEDLFGSLDKTTYSFSMIKPNTESINPFSKTINHISLDYIDVMGKEKTIEINPVIIRDEYNNDFMKISHGFYDEDTESHYSFEINNFGYSPKQYEHIINEFVNVKITCDIFVEHEMSAMLAVGKPGRDYTFFCEATDIRISYVDVDNKMLSDLIENVEFNKISNLPLNLKKQSEDDSIVMKLKNISSLYKDISNFNVDDVSSMNHCPSIFEEVAYENVIVDDKYYLVGTKGIAIENEHAGKGRGIKFVIPPKKTVSVWVDWQSKLLAQLYNEEGELLDESYENRPQTQPYFTHYVKNIFEIKNSEDTPITYYIVFTASMPDWHRCRVFDIKALLIDEIDNTIKPIEDKVENNEVILTDDRHQEISISNTNVLNLVLPTGKEYEEIHLHTELVNRELIIYNSSINGSNAWNGFGYSSQYIPVEGGTFFYFYPTNVTTANIELIQYTDTNNVRGTVISKNTTVTLNENTKYIKINMWDKSEVIHETIVLNDIEYTLTLVEKPNITEVSVFNEYGSPDEGLTLTFSEPCKLYGVDKLKYGKIYELELIKSHGEWICRNPNSQIGSIQTAVIRQINYLKDEEFTKEFECINMTFEEAKSIVMTGGVLTILLQLSSGATLPTTYYVDYEFEVSYNEFIITAWKYEDGSREVLNWREDGLVMF